MISLYLHIPFCDHHCRYCSFAIIPTHDLDQTKRNPLIANYLQTLTDQIIYQASIWGKQEIKTVYIGGGTPSILSAEDFFYLYKTIETYFDLMYLEERTIEVNPNPFNHVLELIKTLSTKRKHMMKLRRSIGIQTFDNTILAESGRQYTFLALVDFLRTLIPLTRQGHLSFSLDFIAFGRLIVQGKNHDPQFWNQSARDFFVDIVYSKCFEGFSLYALELFEGSPRYYELPNDQKSISGKNKYGSDDDIYTEYSILKDIILDAGYTRYELSNYSIMGRNGIHNRLYRNHGDYLGLGLHASSGIFSATNRDLLVKQGRDANAVGYRRINPRALHDYTKSVQELGSCYESLSVSDLAKEKIFLGLRVREGVTMNVLNECTDVLVDDWQTRTKDRQKQGFCEVSGEGLRLSDQGMDVYNTLMTDLLK